MPARITARAPAPSPRSASRCSGAAEMDAMFAAAGRNAYAAFAAGFPAPDRVFIENHDGRTVTYGEAARLTARMANLLGQHGIQAGDRVAGLLDKSPEGILLYLACCRAGAVYL